ncbi:hypothetical protein S7711_10027 [Stachybotrys chartarum IBT 7711]|uniref:CHAT domain-containing protein n=1 Tax=Stachybotrys chartarum (strain CBS 109288 / IBT 7711) TaxID=1280523 RepID=A0A084AEX5_STACB|nr:hypothetical protein S7711_10027 [Stachybotrys chartarum IBT 7711]
MEDPPRLAELYYAITTSYNDRSETPYTSGQLDQSIYFDQKPLDTTPEPAPERVHRLHELRSTYADEYDLSGGVRDLDKVIQLDYEIMNLIDEDGQDLKLIRQMLQLLSLDHYARSLHQDDDKHWGYLIRSIELLDKALCKTLPDDPIRAELYESLAFLHYAQYEKFWDLVHLETVINFTQQALDNTPINNRDRPQRLCNLADRYHDRFKELNALEDLNHAIQFHREAIDTIAIDDVLRPLYLARLASAYDIRYHRVRNLSDNNCSISLSQEALSAEGPSGLIRTTCLGQLADAYQIRYSESLDVADLELSIQHGQKAVDATPMDDMNRSSRLQNLALGYFKRFIESDDAADCDLFIKLNQDAEACAPNNDPSRAARYVLMGLGRLFRLETSATHSDIEASIQNYHDALNDTDSLIHDRFRAGKDLLFLCRRTGNWSLAYQAACTASSLISLLVTESSEASDKQFILTHLAGFAQEAAAVALMAGKSAYESLQLLEVGRSIIAGSSHRLRADVFDLQQNYPYLARDYIEHRNKLIALTPSAFTALQLPPRINRVITTHRKDIRISNVQRGSPALVNIESRSPNRLGIYTSLATHQPDSSTTLCTSSYRRFVANQSLDLIIDDIRKKPGFDRFLLSPTESELMQASIRGPIIIINGSSHRTDAFLIEKEELRVLPLPHISPEVIEHESMEYDAGRITTDMLEALWDSVAEPVLDALGFTQTPTGTWPRVWWILTGPLSKFPIHAAGYHRSGTSTVLDRVISTYSSSLKTLIHARRHHGRVGTAGSAPRKAVLTSMQHTPGHQDLPFALEEIEKLDSLCRSMQLEICRASPRRADILSAIHDCKIFHFAGHGETDVSHPLNSAILLDKAEVFTVGDLLEINLHKTKPFLAYLSACGTGQTRHSDLSDENLHLIAACQIAGFRHVIGTLWEVNDKLCVEMATGTYGYMKQYGMNDDAVSGGLHHTCRSLRSRWVVNSAERKAAMSGRETQKSWNESNIKEESCSGGDSSRVGRDVTSCDDLPLSWVPYVHYGM